MWRTGVVSQLLTSVNFSAEVTLEDYRSVRWGVDSSAPFRPLIDRNEQMGEEILEQN